MDRPLVTAVAVVAATVLLLQLGVALWDEGSGDPVADRPVDPGSGGSLGTTPPTQPGRGEQEQPTTVHGTPWVDRPPNFLIILVDDQNDGTMRFMPRTQARVFGEGASFLNTYVTTPVCCPSRVSQLTGQLASHHGTRTNFMPNVATELLPQHLKDAGYTTGHVGKYLNTWDGRPRAEYDFWVAHAGAQTGYFDPRLNVNGVWSTHEGYVTDLFADRVVDFLDGAASQDQPFAMFWWPNAPHGPAEPHPNDLDLYDDVPLHRPPSLNEEDVRDKPQWIQDLPPVSEARAQDMDSLRLRQLRTLASLDRAVDRVLDRLDAHGFAEDTVVFYLSDNGILTGEHRLIDKHYAYEEAIRVPFGMRYPAWLTDAVVEDSLVTNLDVPATIYELAGITPPQVLHGRSLVDLLVGTNDWRTSVFLEAWPRVSPPWQGVHTGTVVYWETEGDIPELYDLHRDPYQLDNLANDAEHLVLRERMEALLDEHRATTSTRRVHAR